MKSPNFHDNETAIRVGVSSCLLGNLVRYDGGHRRLSVITDVLADFFEWVPVCPEVEVGMGVPRETLRLWEGESETQLVADESRTNYTKEMRSWSEAKVRSLQSLGLCGFVFKKNSPSCGAEGVAVYSDADEVRSSGRGIFAETVVDSDPSLPVEEEGSLEDEALRDHFIERIFARHRLRVLCDSDFSHGDLIDFHTHHKLQLTAHSPEACRHLGRLVAEGSSKGSIDLRETYTTEFMRALKDPATPGRHINVLQHVFGYFSEFLSADEKSQFLRSAEKYRDGAGRLERVMTLARLYLQRHELPYLEQQSYLEPDKRERRARSGIYANLSRAEKNPEMSDSSL